MTQLAGALSSFAVVAVIAIALPAHAARPVEDGPSYPEVNMERLLMAAQLDSYRPDNRTTAGAVKSVKRVQRALGVAVDGNFGSQTMLAYSQWQQRLSIDANGLPDETSLTRLGEGRFEVKRIVRPGSQVDVGEVGDEQEINRRTNRMLIAAARRLRGDCRFVVTKGSYKDPDDDSSATHSGGGALDIRVWEGCGARRNAVKALRQVGFAAWYRDWTDNQHIHAIAISDPSLSTPISHSGTTAMHQVVSYYRGRNGLDDDGLDDGPDVTKRTWEQYKRSR
jgi:hypothetical protein